MASCIASGVLLSPYPATWRITFTSGTGSVYVYLNQVLYATTTLPSIDVTIDPGNATDIYATRDANEAPPESHCDSFLLQWTRIDGVDRYQVQHSTDQATWDTEAYIGQSSAYIVEYKTAPATDSAWHYYRIYPIYQGVAGEPWEERLYMCRRPDTPDAEYSVTGSLLTAATS